MRSSSATRAPLTCPAPCIAFMEEFFKKTGNVKLRFKPAYNPYTEVSRPYFVQQIKLMQKRPCSRAWKSSRTTKVLESG